MIKISSHKIYIQWEKILKPLFIIDISLILLIIFGFRLTNDFFQEIINIFLGTTFLPLLVYNVCKFKINEKYKELLKTLKILCLLLLIPITAIVWFVYFISLLAVLNDDFEPRLEKIQIINLEHRDIVSYLVNAPATVDFSVQINSERRILPGLKYVNVIASYYHVEYIELEKLSNDKVKVTEIKITNSGRSDSLLPQLGSIIEI